MIISFKDLNGIQVELSFEKNTFSIEARHVLVLAKHQKKWLLTKHPKRGIEFPGGKVEGNESILEAAIRETWEETNVEIKNVKWLAEYLVHDEKPFCKAVFIAEVGYIEEKRPNFETDGALWLSTDDFLHNNNFSFHMRDAGMKAILEKVSALEGKWNNREN